jgi:hypothetical protein
MKCHNKGTEDNVIRTARNFEEEKDKKGKKAPQ